MLQFFYRSTQTPCCFCVPLGSSLSSQYEGCSCCVINCYYIKGFTQSYLWVSHRLLLWQIKTKSRSGGKVTFCNTHPASTFILLNHVTMSKKENKRWSFQGWQTLSCLQSSSQFSWEDRIPTARLTWQQTFTKAKHFSCRRHRRKSAAFVATDLLIPCPGPLWWANETDL